MKFIFPEVSSRQEAVIVQWYAALNDKVMRGDDILEVTSDKATFDISSPCDGTIIKIFKFQGETVVPGEMIAEIRE